MFNVGPEKLMVVLLIALIVLGPDKLPNAARQIGRYLNEFRRISQGFQQELRSAMDVTDTGASASAAAAAASAHADPEPAPATDDEAQPGPELVFDAPAAAPAPAPAPADPAPAPAPNNEDDQREVPPTIPPALGQVDPSRATQA
jgi:Tat protein translocase TatB subunit